MPALTTAVKFVFSPEHSVGEVALALTLGPPISLMLMVPVVVQPLASVIVTVQVVPPGKLLAVAVVEALHDHA